MKKLLRYFFNITISLLVAINLSTCSALYDSPGDRVQDENLSQISVSGVKYGQIFGEFAINGEKTAPKDADFIANSSIANENIANSFIAKTVMPDINISDIATYSLIATAQGFDNFEVSNPFASTYSLSLPYNPRGTEWTIKATGKNAGGTAITFCTKKITLSADNPSASANIDLRYSQDSANGKGAFKITVNFPTDKNIKKVKYSFAKKADAPSYITVDAPDTGTIIINSDDSGDFTLDPGPYDGTIKFLSGSDTLGYTEVYAVNQTVNIYSNLVTTKLKGTAPYIGSNGSFDIPSSFGDVTTFFVGGNGIGEDHKAASDSNNGTLFDPFATLGHVVKIINASDTASFVIKLMGDTAEDGAVSINYGKSVTIQAYDSTASAKPVINFCDNGILNTFGALVLNGIGISHGFSKVGGGGIYVSSLGSLKADKIIISDCSDTSEERHVGGGGILALGAVELKNSEIKNCKTSCDSSIANSYGGGAICYTGTGDLILSNVTFSGNSAPTSKGKDIYFANGNADFKNLTGDNTADDNTASIYWEYRTSSSPSMKLSGNINAMPLCLTDKSQIINCDGLLNGGRPIKVLKTVADNWTFTTGFTGTPVSAYFVGVGCTIDAETSGSMQAVFIPGNFIYVSPDGSDDTGDGTQTKPYATFKKAALSFANKTDVTTTGIPLNTVYFLDDMTITEGMGFTDKCAVNLVGCKGGSKNSPVKITSSLNGSVLQVQKGQNFVIENINWTGDVNYGALLVQDEYSEGTKLTVTDCEFTDITGKGVSVIALEGGTLSLKNVKITGNTTSANDTSWTGGAVYVKGGTFIVNDGVIINSNTAADGASANNLYLWGDDSTPPGMQALITVGEPLTTTNIEFAMYHTATVSSSVTFTSGYKTSGNTADPKTFFIEENGCGIDADSDSGEAVEKGRRYFYVRGTGGVYSKTYPAAAAASDTTNNGTRLSPYATMQKAVNEISALNDERSTYEIIVGGEFNDIAGTTDALVSINANGKTLDIEITGLSNSDGETVFDGSSLSGKPCVKIVSSNNEKKATILMNNISITGGDTSTNNGNGGGIQVGNYSYLMLKDCKIYGNKAENGGGLYCGENTDVVLDNSTVNDCSSTNGGGIYCVGELQLENDVVIENNTVTGNGGGLYAKNAVVNVDGTVQKNEASAGGGIYIDENCAVELKGSILENSAKSGGGIYSADALELGTGLVIAKNSATGIDASGGGVYCKGDLTINGATIGGADASSGNTSEKNGGGVYAYSTFKMTDGNIQGNTSEKDGGGVYACSTFEMTDGTIQENTSEKYGGGVYACSTFEMTDGTIQGNKASAGGGVCLNDLSTLSGGAIISNYAISTTDITLGGGIYAQSTADTTIKGSVYILSNTSGSTDPSYKMGYGGGILSSGTLSIKGGYIADNKALSSNLGQGVFGGGVCVIQIAGNNNTFTMSGGTIGGVIYNGVNYDGNRAENGCGGGIASLSMPLEITGGLIGSDTNLDKGNIANSGGGISLCAFGNMAVPATLTGSGGTVSYNTATSQGGGGLYFVEGYSSASYALSHFENNSSHQVYNGQNFTSLKD